MKRKVLVLTMGVICATQLWHSNHANALVTESGANDTKQFTEIVSEEKVITVEHAQINIFQSNSNSNLMEFNILTMGGKSGAMVGSYGVKLTHHISQTVTNALFRRDHVKEAQSLVENYKDTQSADARMKAKQKVNTLSKPHQNYFNKQIDKVYNGLQR